MQKLCACSVQLKTNKGITEHIVCLCAYGVSVSRLTPVSQANQQANELTESLRIHYPHPIFLTHLPTI